MFQNKIQLIRLSVLVQVCKSPGEDRFHYLIAIDLTRQACLHNIKMSRATYLYILSYICVYLYSCFNAIYVITNESFNNNHNLLKKLKKAIKRKLFCCFPLLFFYNCFVNRYLKYKKIQGKKASNKPRKIRIQRYLCIYLLASRRFSHGHQPRAGQINPPSKYRMQLDTRQK